MRNLIIYALVIFGIFVFAIDDSVYAAHEQKTRGVDDPKIAVEGDDVYVVWGQSFGPDFYDLVFVRSSDGGKTFDEPINLTNGISFYPDPRIHASDNNVYVLWEDRTSPDGVDSIFFTKSNDGGFSFDQPRTLDPVDDLQNLIYKPIEIIESNNILYIFASNWDRQTKQNKMFFITSNDFGDTFSEPIVFFEDEQWEDFVDFAVADDGTIYVLADDKKNYDEVGDLNLRKILPDGNLSEIVKVNGGNTAATTSHLAIEGNHVYVSWRAWENDRWYLSFAKSSDGGNTFSPPRTLNADPDSIDTVGTMGSSVFAKGDSVFVISREEYWDGENQSFQIWIRTSNNRGDDFDAVIHPLDDLLKEHGDIMTIQQDENIYSMAMTTKNPPFNDGALYFSHSEDGKSFSGHVDILKNNPPRFRLPDVATGGDSIHLVAEGNPESSCILYTVSHNKGGSFSAMKNLGSKGTEMECLGTSETILPPKHQIMSGTDIEDIKCKLDRSKGYLLVLRERDGQPVCITAQSYLPLIERGWIQEDSQQFLSMKAAEEFILSSPTFSFDGIKDSLYLEESYVRKSIPPAVTITGEFQSLYPGYGNRQGQEFPLKEKTYKKQFEIQVVQINKIHSAIIDDTWDETRQDFMENIPNERQIHGHNYGPTSRIVLTFGDAINQRGMVPLAITEVSENVSDFITFWQFQPAREDSATNRGKTWDFLPESFRKEWGFVARNGNDVWDDSKIPQEQFGIPLDGHGYPTICGDRKIGGQSWHPSTIPVKPEFDTVLAKSGNIGYYPDSQGVYRFDYVSLFDTKLEFPNNLKIIEKEMILCPMERLTEDATHAFYTRLEFKFEDEWTKSYYSEEFREKSDSIHERATILVKIFDDKFDFNRSQFQLQDPEINFESAEQDLIHRYSKDATIGYFFETLGMQLTSDCLVIPEGREFCDDGDSLRFYVNDEEKEDISEYLINEDDKILITYGSETSEIARQLEELESIARFNYQSLEKLMTIDVGVVSDGTYDGDLGFKTAEKLMMIDMKRQEEKNILEHALSQKKYAYETLANQNADMEELESIQDEIKQMELQLSELASGQDYTSEEIFQKVNEIESENIKMYKLGPEKYKQYVSAMKSFESEARNAPFQLNYVAINPEKVQLEIMIQKDSTEPENYTAIIDEMIPDDISWVVNYSD